MFKKLPNLRGKTALVTGASSGLGAEFARLLAMQQCNLILVARRQERLEALKTELEKVFSIKVVVIIRDLSAPYAAQALHEQIKSLNLVVDILINNAGVGVGGNFYEVDPKQLKNMLDLNMVNFTLLTQLVVKEMMLRQQPGYILFISSIAADLVSARMIAYSATKSYVSSLGLGLHMELAPIGVHCSVLAPGPMPTEFFDVAETKDFKLLQKLAGLKPRDVARYGLAGLFRHKAYIVPGVMNKISLLASRCVPRTWIILVTKKLLDLGHWLSERG